MKLLIKNRQLKACKKENIYDSKLFTGWLDSDFKNWELKETKSVKAMEIACGEIEKDGMFKDIFSSLSSDLDSLCLTQGQILEIVRNHSDFLYPQGWAMFFLFKVGDDFFVAHVRLRDGLLGAYVDRLSHEHVWDADHRHRVVVPQLALKNSEPSPSDSSTLDTSDVKSKVTALIGALQDLEKAL